LQRCFICANIFDAQVKGERFVKYFMELFYVLLKRIPVIKILYYAVKKILEIKNLYLKQPDQGRNLGFLLTFFAFARAKLRKKENLF